MIDCEHDCRPYYDMLIGPLRERAYELGYALCHHGTLKRDIDLVAVPWIREAADPQTLAEALRHVARGVIGKADMKWDETRQEFWRNGRPGDLPHGRLSWLIFLGGPHYIDLAVMPRIP